LDIPALDNGTIPSRVPVQYVLTAYNSRTWTEIVVYLRDVNSNVYMQSHVDGATTGWQQWNRAMVIEPGEYEMSVVGRVGFWRFTDHKYFTALE